jgi:8-oxo-dGTP pyrophosphatase MutT (NUDIX family)
MTEALLVSSRKVPGAWVLPGGKVEPGEGLAHAAARECREESGWQVVVERFLGTAPVGRTGPPEDLAVFLGRPRRFVGGGEADRRVRWVPLEELAALLPLSFSPLLDGLPGKSSRDGGAPP